MKRQNNLLNCQCRTILVSIILLGGVAPHVFQLVKPAAFRQHDVDDDIHVIDQDPLKGSPAFMLIGKLFAILLYQFLYRIGNRFYLGCATGFTNNEKIRHCFRYFSQIEGNDILRFLFLYCLDDCS